MRATPNDIAGKDWPLRRTVFLACALAGAVEIVLLLAANRSILTGTLFDPDCYMHLQRALRMMTDGIWQALPDPRVNAPFGASLHWTALFDMLLVTGAMPLRLLGWDAPTALYVWGCAISPVLLLAALALYAKGVEPWVKGPNFLWLVIVLFLEPQFAGTFLVGRPDHHSLVMLLLMAQLAWLYAVLDKRATLRWAAIAGVFAGLQMCTSVEALLTILVAALTLVSAWVFTDAKVLRPLAVYLAAGTATIALWLLWQGGAAAYDRISVVHLVALGSGTAVFAILAIIEARLRVTKPMRVFAAVLAGAMATTVTAAFYPDFFLGPWPHLDATTRAWHASISELRPLVPVSIRTAAVFLVHFTPALLSLPLIVRGLFLERRLYLLPSFVGVLVFGGLTLAQGRWASELGAVVLLPWTLTTLAILRSTASMTVGRVRVPLRTAGLAGAILLQFMPTALANGGRHAPPVTPTGEACPWTSVERVLPRESGAILLTDVWHGPEILWRTPLSVVGAPYEIAPALADTQRYLMGNGAAARAAIARRNVSYVLVCSAETSGRFVADLGRGRHPAWLMPMPLPKDMTLFKLYRVARD